MGKKGNNTPAALNVPFGLRNHSHAVPKQGVPEEFYHTCTSSDKHVLDILKFLFLPEQWGEFFHKTYANVTKRRQVMRMMIQASTIDSCLRGYYLPDGTQVRLDKRALEKSAASTKMYQSDYVFSKLKEKASAKKLNTTKTDNNTNKNNNNNDNNTKNENNSTTITDTNSPTSTITPSVTDHSLSPSSPLPSSSLPCVLDCISSSPPSLSSLSLAPSSSTPNTIINKEIETHIKDGVLIIEGDCLEAAIWVKRYFQADPIVLNMASRSHPGGGYRNGAGAQEESLHRRTNLFQCLEDPYNTQKRNWSYPLPEFGGVYSKDVYVLRDNEELGYGFKKVPETLSFVAVSAYSTPPVETQGNTVVLSHKIAQLTTKKIETIFNIAVHNGHDTIVLGAFGCGAYGNPASHISLLFKQVIKQFKPLFRLVVFAIIDGKSDMNPKGNLFYFTETFQCPAIKLSDLP